MADHAGEHAGEEEHAGEVYNVNLQVGGLFIVITASVLGIVSSYVLARQGGKEGCDKSSALQAVIVFVKGLSCGVVISVALVHLISEAYEGYAVAGWTFPAWPMVFVMVGIYFMAAMDLIGQRFYSSGEVGGGSDHGHGHGHAGALVLDGAQSCEPATTKEGVLVTNLRVTACVVEIGILLHSIIIGLDLGLQNEDSWAIILVAVALHQFLEGLMLGQVLGELRNNDEQASRRKVWTMIILFTLTTAVGIAIGIIVRTSTADYADPVAMELTLAILNSLAGGLLLYLGLASLLVPWFVSSPTMRVASKTFVAIGFIGLAFGLAGMTAISLAEGVAH